MIFWVRVDVCVSFDRIQPPENPPLLMCTERMGGFSSFKQESIMFHKNHNLRPKVFIEVKFMKDGW